MIELLPYYYQKSDAVKELYDAVRRGLQLAENELSRQDKNLFITTTDEFMLHERDVGLTSISSDNDTLRGRVVARLQGERIMTLDALKDIVKAYEKTGCVIREDYSKYTVVVIFYYRVGFPEGLEELKKTIEELKPAHLQFEYQISSNTWNDLNKKLSSWDEAKNYTWNTVKGAGENA